MSDPEEEGKKAADCTYKSNTYPSGSKICQTRVDGGTEVHVCMECIDGTWVPTGAPCPPGHDGDPC